LDLRRATTTVAALLCTLILGSQPIHAGAQQQVAAPTEGQVLHILINKSVVINTQAPITRILTSNPTAIETIATSPTQVVVSGKAAGTSSLIIWDSPDHSQILDVVVEPDVTALRTALERAFPGQKINVDTDGARLILSGTVPSQKIADDAVKLAGLYATQVVNSLTVAIVIEHDRQVMLEVRFAEVDRSRLQAAGLNILSTGATNTIGVISTQQFGPPTFQSAGAGGGGGGANNSGGLASSSFQFNDILNIFLFRPDLNLAVTIKDLEQKALLEILAEPNLMALNGQKASFLAGGEFPFPVVQGGANVGAVTIQFRPFGVKLDFTGTINPDNIIRLHVAPEVATLDFANSVSISGFVVPAISTRRAETEIELKDGQSFGIAGLLDHRAQAQLNKIPGIADIPILGKLFTSRSINRGNTELIVIVTPRIVDPVNQTTVAPQPPKYPMPFLDPQRYDKSIPGNESVGSAPQPK
jgi:pilus assembly protein CpaC